MKTCDEYVALFPPNVQAILREVRRVIKEAAPEAVEKISYRIPTFCLNGNLVHFAAHTNHIGFYPTPSGIVAFKDELYSYKWAKGSVQFPLDRPMPFEVIKRIVEFRVKESSIKGRKTRQS